MVKYCECGCGAIIPNKNHFVRWHYNKIVKGIKRGSYVKQYGEEKAEKINLKKSQALKGRFMITYEERFGKEKAEEKKLKLKIKSQKGIKRGSNISYYGLEKALEIKKKMSKGRKGKGIKWKNNYIINTLKQIIKDNGPIKIMDIDRLRFFGKYKITCLNNIRNRFGSLNNVEKLIGIKFKYSFEEKSRCGLNETKILDEKEKEFGYKILRQYRLVSNQNNLYYIDGYIPQLNLVIEIYELRHKFFIIKDEIRKKDIINTLKCIFLIINEQEWINNKKQIILNKLVI